MRKYKHLLVILPAVLTAAILQEEKLQEFSKGSVEGFVHDDKGAPIPRASVQAFNIMHGWTTSASSQPDGFFRILDLVGGRYSLWVQASGYTSDRIPTVIVNDGRPTRKDIQLKREFTFTGHRLRHP